MPEVKEPKPGDIYIIESWNETLLITEESFELRNVILPSFKIGRMKGPHLIKALKKLGTYLCSIDNLPKVLKDLYEQQTRI